MGVLPGPVVKHLSLTCREPLSIRQVGVDKVEPFYGTQCAILLFVRPGSCAAFVGLPYQES